MSKNAEYCDKKRKEWLKKYEELRHAKDENGEPKYTERQIAAAFGKSVLGLRHQVSTYRLIYWYQDIIKYMKLKEEGKTRSEIMDILGKTESTLNSWDKTISEM